MKHCRGIRVGSCRTRFIWQRTGSHESRRQFALFVTKPARLESYATRAPLLSYYYYFIFASQHDPLASPSRGTDTPHCAGGQWRGTGYPWHANGGYGRSSVSHTYIRTCDSTYTHIHDERHRYPGALNSHLIASNDNEEREYPSHIPAQLPHPPLLQPPVRPLTCPIAIYRPHPPSGYSCTSQKLIRRYQILIQI